jgi:hypothetical protein
MKVVWRTMFEEQEKRGITRDIRSFEKEADAGFIRRMGTAIGGPMRRCNSQ